MSGDHNMNQKTTGIHEQKFYAEQSKPIQLGPQLNTAISGAEHNMTQKQDIEQYKSQIERQCIEMQAALDLLKATVETLHMRLRPVMVDAPMRTAANDLSPVASPLGLSINQYRQQTTAVIDELAFIIESLEI